MSSETRRKSQDYSSLSTIVDDEPNMNHMSRENSNIRKSIPEELDDELEEELDDETRQQLVMNCNEYNLRGSNAVKADQDPYSSRKEVRNHKEGRYEDNAQSSENDANVSSFERQNKIPEKILRRRIQLSTSRDYENVTFVDEEFEEDPEDPRNQGGYQGPGDDPLWPYLRYLTIY